MLLLSAVKVFEPPLILKSIFLMLLPGSLARVILPVLLPDLCILWIGLSQVCWIVSFALFIWIYTPMLLKPRVDGNYG
jgi:uncharacterized protein involved in response to NO